MISLRHTAINKRSVFPFLLILVALQGLRSQNDTKYIQYMYATNVINPAYAGSPDMLRIISQYRAQWTGVNGAPRTFNLVASTPLKNPRMGLGATFITENIGPASEQTLAGDFSYALELNRYTRLLLGVKGGLKLINIDFAKLDIYDTTDPAFQNNVYNRFSPTVGTGAYLYNDLWYAGLSVPNLLTTRYYNDTSVSTAKERAAFYAMGGYVFSINDKLMFKPAFLAKMTRGEPLGLDLSANFMFKEKFTLGATYRVGNALGALLGFQATDQIMIGYSYDMDTTRLGNYSKGSHGVFLRFDIGSGRIYRSLGSRFF